MRGRALGAIPAAAREARSSRLSRLFAEQTLWAQDHDHDQEPEDDGGGPLGSNSCVRDLLDTADDHPTEHRPADVANSTHHRGGEGDQTGFEALEVPDRR